MRRGSPLKTEGTINAFAESFRYSALCKMRVTPDLRCYSSPHVDQHPSS